MPEAVVVVVTVVGTCASACWVDVSIGLVRKSEKNYQTIKTYEIKAETKEKEHCNGYL